MNTQKLEELLPKDLTAEQTKVAEQYIEKWATIARSTEGCDRPRAEAAVQAAYIESGYPAPRFIWADSPQQATKILAKELHQNMEPTQAQSRDFMQRCAYGNMDGPWVAFFEFVAEQLKLGEHIGIAKHLIELAYSSGWWFPYAFPKTDKTPGLCVMCERPLVLKLDAQDRPHCLDGPAIAYGDGYKVFAVTGIAVKEHWIEQPQTIAVSEILEEQNAELRRLLMPRFGELPKEQREHDYDGTGLFLIAAGAKTLDVCADSDPKQPVGMLGARLLYLDIPDDEPVAMLDLRNSTLETDGSRKRYFIEVPPTMKTVREAVAWTFQMTPEEYAPVMES